MNNSVNDDLIDLKTIIQELWKKKLVILLSSFVGALIGLFYFNIQPKEYKSYFQLNKVNIHIFDQLDISFNNHQLINNNSNNQPLIKKSFKEVFFEDWKKNIFSIKNFHEFLKENTNYENNIISKFKILNAETKDIYTEGKFYFFYPKLDSAHDLISKYITEIRNRVFEEHKKKINLHIQLIKKTYQEAVNESKSVGFLKPILPNHLNYNSTHNHLFFLGSEVLEKRLLNIENLINNLNNLSLESSAVFDKSSYDEINHLDKYFLILVGFFASFFISIFLIFLSGIIFSKKSI